MMKVPCYKTKTGIRIGSAYVPPVRQLTSEEARVQAALLGVPGGGLSVKVIAVLTAVAYLGLIWVTT